MVLGISVLLSGSFGKNQSSLLFRSLCAHFLDVVLQIVVMLSFVSKIGNVATTVMWLLSPDRLCDGLVRRGLQRSDSIRLATAVHGAASSATA